MSKTDIENKLEHWYKIVEDSIQKTILIKTHTTLQKDITDPLLKSIQYEHDTLQNIGGTRGWTLREYYRYKLLKTLLKNLIKSIQETN